MSNGRQRTLLFCTAYAMPHLGKFYNWDQRYTIWLKGIRSSNIHFDQILIVDDASPTVPEWSDVTVLGPGDPLQTQAELVFYRFDEHLGRRAVSDFPGWVRSFFFAAEFAEANGHEKILHLESDAFLISPRIQNWVNELRDGWTSLWCPRHRRPESGIQIIAGSAMQTYKDFASQPVEALAGAVIETTLPFTHVESGFIGDRYGEFQDYVPRQAEWCMQAVPNGKLPPEIYYWWLPDMTEIADRMAQDSSVDVLTRPVPTEGHAGVWYTDFFWHLDKVGGPTRYFEIGTHTGSSLRAFSCDALCVDPKFIVSDNVIAGRKRTMFFQGTSDEFFQTGELDRMYPQGYDIAFLDGLHLAEALLRDFINAEKSCAPGAMIILHDCLPFNERMAERDRRFGDESEPAEIRDYWTGDVWKLLPALKKYRPDLAIAYLDAKPTGLVICKRLSRNSTALADNYDAIVAEMETATLSALGFDALWEMFPTLSTRELIANPALMRKTFGFARPE
jgi:hypothetical protein